MGSWKVAKVADLTNWIGTLSFGVFTLCSISLFVIFNYPKWFPGWFIPAILVISILGALICIISIGVNLFIVKTPYRHLELSDRHLELSDELDEPTAS